MSQIDPLPSNNKVCTMSVNSDIYLRVPFRKKNSGDYRAYAKTLNAKYDPNAERWYISQVNLTPDIINTINKMNMFDGYRYSRAITNNSNALNELYNCVTSPIFKCIQYTQHKSVHFYTYSDFNFVQMIYFSGTSNAFSEIFSNIDHIRKHSTFDIIIPKEFARDEYSHYATMNNSAITDVPVEYARAFFQHFKHIKIP